MLKIHLVHTLNPLHLWCRGGGKYKRLFIWYENFIWNKFLYKVLKTKDEKKKLLPRNRYIKKKDEKSFW